MKQILAAIAVLALLTGTARGEMITFDFDSGAPPLNPGKALPWFQTVGGVTAAFSSPNQLPGQTLFAAQYDNDPMVHLSQFSGYYLYDAKFDQAKLQILFSAPLDSITLGFAVTDLPDNVDEPSFLGLTAYLNSTGTTPVGTASARGTFDVNETWPQAKLTFDSAGVPFNLVELGVLHQPSGTWDFYVDNISVNVIPEPATLVLLGIGLLWLAPLICRRRGR